MSLINPLTKSSTNWKFEVHGRADARLHLPVDRHLRQSPGDAHDHGDFLRALVQMALLPD